jgi:alpha-glucosidase
VEVWSSVFGGWMVSGESMVDLVESVTSVTGRQGVMPQWSQRGAVVGLEGGTQNVTAIVTSLLANGVPVAGVWLQDWVGLRHDWDGDRLIWNWEVNYDYYPGGLKDLFIIRFIECVFIRRILVDRLERNGDFLGRKRHSRVDLYLTFFL